MTDEAAFRRERLADLSAFFAARGVPALGHWAEYLRWKEAHMTVITQHDAVVALDQIALERIVERQGLDTVTTWLFQIRFNLPRPALDRQPLSVDDQR